MGRTKAKKGSKQTALTGSGFWPMLSKPAIAIGKHASVPGKYWNGCPAADKEKRFMCIVVEFTAMHDFGDGVKGAGFKLKEMGEDGRCSLEPGVASGSEFIMAYLSLLLAPSMEVLRTNKTRAATASWSKSSRRRLPY